MATIISRAALVALSLCAFTITAAPARVLFPSNLHLTREVSDPLSGAVTTVDEYCSGNRMVSVSGERTVIADYEKQEITEIDRRAGTYSVTRFADVAGTNTPNAASDRGETGPRVKVGVEIDRSRSLTREALEVLIGAAYPNTVRAEHAAVLEAAAAQPKQRGIAANDADAAYGLPVVQSYTHGEPGSELTFRSTITRVGDEAVPAEALIIPSSARRVESPAASLRRQLRELDQPR